MSKQLNDPSNADAPETPGIEPTGEIQLTDREIAIAEGRDPDAPEEIESPVADVEDESFDQPADEVAEQVAPPAEPAAPWYSDSDRQYAEGHGLSEWHLQQFNSREDFRRAASLLDATAASRQSAPAKAAPEPPAAAEPVEEEYIDEPVVNGKINVEWYRRNDYDDGTVKAMEAQRAWQDKIEASFAEQETRAQEQQRLAEEAESQRQINAFHEAADALRPDFYGRSIDDHGNVNRLTPEQEKRREVLFDEVYWLSQRIAYEQQRSTGRVAIPSWSTLIKQAEPRAFGEELNRKTREQQLADAKAQARTIRPAAGSVGAGTARRTSTTPKTENVAEIAQDPDVIEAWNRATTSSR